MSPAALIAVARRFAGYFIQRTINYYGFRIRNYEEDDIKQECYLALLESADLVDEQQNVYGYVRRVVRNTVIEYVHGNNVIQIPRRSGHRPGKRIPFYMLPVSRRVAVRVEIKDFSELHTALETVRSNYAAAVRHCYGVDAPLTPVAAYARENSVSRATVRKRLNKGLEELRQKLPEKPERKERAA